MLPFVFKVDGMLQNLEKEIDDVDAKIGDHWRILDRCSNVLFLVIMLSFFPCRFFECLHFIL
jgi:hypothetical protein